MITEGLDLLIDIGNDLYETMPEEFLSRRSVNNRRAVYKRCRKPIIFTFCCLFINKLKTLC